MTAKACAYSPSGWSVAASSGPRRRTERWHSHRRSLAICWRASAGGCRHGAGAHKRPDRPATDWLSAALLRAPQWQLCLHRRVTSGRDSLPLDLASAHALIIAQREALLAAELRAIAAESEAKFRALLIEKLKFTIA